MDTYLTSVHAVEAERLVPPQMPMHIPQSSITAPCPQPSPIESNLVFAETPLEPTPPLIIVVVLREHVRLSCIGGWRCSAGIQLNWGQRNDMLRWGWRRPILLWRWVKSVAVGGALSVWVYLWSSAKATETILFAHIWLRGRLWSLNGHSTVERRIVAAPIIRVGSITVTPIRPIRVYCVARLL